MPRLRPLFDRNSIRFRLFRLVVAVASATLVISMAGGVLFEWNNQQQQVRQSLSAMAQATGVAASAAVAFHDRTAAGEVLRLLVTRKDVEAVALYPLEGYRLASHGDNSRLPDNVAPLREHLPSFSLFSPTTTLFQPILLDDTTIGHIYIVASLSDYRHTFLRQAALAIGINLLGLVLVLWFGLRLIDDLVRPVQKLAATAQQVREQRDYALRVPPELTGSRQDEIAELVASFNAMLAEIEQRERELLNYHDNLERMVEERTNALHEANQALLLAKDSAESASLAKSRFLAAASHDLRQPIQAISLFQNALSRTELDNEQKRINDYLSRSVLSLGELLNALLDISKLDAGVIVPKPEAIAVEQLFSRIDGEFSPVAAARSLRFKLHFPLAAMSLFTDGKLLLGLVRNLIGNAIEYTQRGGVLVAIRRRGDQALFQVWDSGIGIAPEHMDAIFDEYFQVGNPERDKSKGLGLGLAIANRLAGLLDTKIVCRSRPGGGSVFEFRLPLVVQAPAPPRAMEASANRENFAAGLAGRLIAVIDDDSMVAKAMQMSLESLGMRPAMYASAEAALADPAITGADYFVSDYRLPGASGIELLQAIQLRAAKPIKAVLLTGETAPDKIEAAQSLRWPVLFKPVDLPSLITALARQDALQWGQGG